MARNGSGVYSLPAGNPVVTGTVISSTWANTTLNDISSALTASIAYDGQTTPVANLPMGTYVHTNVGNATLRTNYPSAGQVQDGVLTYLTPVTGTDTIVATAPISMTTYAAGQNFRFIAAGANTTTGVTININGIGAKSITKNGTTPLAIGDIPANSIVNITYDGTQFQISNADTTLLTTNNTWTGKQTFAGTTANLSSKFINATEAVTVSATAATGTINYDVTTQSVLYYTTNASANWTMNFRGNSGASLDSILSTGEAITVVFLASQGSTAYYNNAITIDGSSVTPKYQGGTAWTAGNASGVDAYSYTIVKTGSATFSVFTSQTQFA